jgi:hypothetical protein
LANAYEAYPRPDEPYYEERHPHLTQGDIVAGLLWAQTGPEIIVVDPQPDGVDVPEGSVPIISFAHRSPLGIVLSDTCDFRHPSAAEIQRMVPGPFGPRTVYHSGFVRVAPIVPLADIGTTTPTRLADIRAFDYVRKIMYLPAYAGSALGAFEESAVLLDRADLANLDYIRRLKRVTQLTLAGRQQLNRKLVYADTGYHVEYCRFSPDLD